MKNKYFLIGITVLTIGCGNKMLKEAEAAYRNEQFVTAAKIYENVLSTSSDNTAMLHLADCYRQMNKHEEAEKWYEKSINTSEATSVDKLRYAEILKEDGKCEQAISMYDAYLLSSPGDGAAKNQRTACNNNSNFQKINPFYTVQVLNLDFSGSCFSPSINGNQILVTAETTHQIGQLADSRSGNGFLDLFVLTPSITEEQFMATNSSSNTLTKTFSIAPLAGNVNTSLHEGSAVFSPDGNKIYFTRSKVVKEKIDKAKDNDNHLEICSADLVHDQWNNIQSLPFNSSEYSNGQPAVTADGNRMYFVSDMPGGLGGTDIYYSDFSEGNWTKPINAGNEINTNGNEMFPTIRIISVDQQEFFFSSDGLAGGGGLDIFKCVMTNGIPHQPERMTAPFNSTNDDFGIVFYPDGNTGYFSSNRGTTGVDKIYSFRKKNPNFFVNLTVLDKETKLPVPETEVEVRNSTNNTTKKLLTDHTGHLIFPADSMTNYVFTLRCTNFFCGFSSVKTSGFKGNFSDTSYATIDLEKIVINKAIRLENIYYDYNKWDIRSDAAIELDKLVKIMIDNPEIKIELSSHTDSRGGDKFNMTLSQKRAQSAVDYIVSKGISKDRITAKGYGESVCLNKCKNGVKCSEEEFQLNRRTEFKVTSIVK